MCKHILIRASRLPIRAHHYNQCMLPPPRARKTHHRARAGNKYGAQKEYHGLFCLYERGAVRGGDGKQMHGVSGGGGDCWVALYHWGEHPVCPSHVSAFPPSRLPAFPFAWTLLTL